MYAQKAYVETDQAGHLKHLPPLPPNQRFEAIFLTVDEIQAQNQEHRRPHPNLAGKLTITGDILQSSPPEAWDLAD